jgi:hypothetical protein
MRVLWSPQKKQARALANSAFELLFGGAAGGGKSDFLLADYVSNVNEWREAWRGVLFRRTYPELETMIARAKELYLPLGAIWNKAEKTFTFPTGSKLQMRFLESDDDVTRYQGQEYTWVGFDELGNYPTDYCWKYMMSRLRSAKGAPCYIRGTANPGGRGHGWIKHRFIDGREPGKIYRIGGTITRCFISSRLQDNRILAEKDPDYIKRLEMLPDYLRRALLEGDWDVFAGQVFDEWRRERHVVKPHALAAGAWVRFYALDWGYGAPYAIVKLAADREGRIRQYGEIYGCVPEQPNTGVKKRASEVAAEAWDDAIKEGVTDIIADPSLWTKDNGDELAVIEYFEKAGFRAARGYNPRVPGWLAVHERLQQEDENGRPLLQIFDNCPHTIRTIPLLTPDKNHPEDIDSKLEDHLADALRYGVTSDFAVNPLSALRRQNAAYRTRRPKRHNVLDDLYRT